MLKLIVKNSSVAYYIFLYKSYSYSISDINKQSDFNFCTLIDYQLCM